MASAPRQKAVFAMVYSRPETPLDGVDFPVGQSAHVGVSFPDLELVTGNIMPRFNSNGILLYL